MTVKLFFALFLCLISSGCGILFEKEALNAGAPKSFTCWKLTGWQTPVSSPTQIFDGNVAQLVSTGCNGQSNYNYWVEVVDANMFVMVRRNDPHIRYVSQQTNFGPPGYYFWHLLVAQNAQSVPPVIIVDKFYSSDLTKTSVTCPIGPCGWID